MACSSVAIAISHAVAEKNMDKNTSAGAQSQENTHTADGMCNFFVTPALCV